MTNLYIEAYEFYHKAYTNSLVLFHIGSEMEAYEDDAEKLNQTLHRPLQTEHDIKCCHFPHSELQDILFNLVQHNVAVSVVEYRDHDGSYSIPKVKEILEDMESDY
jgi:DNA mismatch repair ATPase MutS